MNNATPTGYIVIVSSLLTLLLLLGGMYVFRGPLLSYVAVQIHSKETVVEQQTESSGELVEAIAKVNPAVVSVVVTKDVPVYERYYETFDPWGFFGGISVPRVRENGTEEREVGGGSGFIVSNDGVIVTNRHVVDDTDARYSVLLNNGTSYAVTVLARDEQLDVAILKITDPLEGALTHVQFGDSESLQLGEPVIAIGNALAEFRNSVSVGVVSGLSRSIVASDAAGRSEQLHEVIQTDAAINPGNSGGPLLNRRGEVVGVNVATSQGADNIGFALPAHLVEQVVNSVLEYGEIVRPFLGVRYTMLTPRLAEQNNISVEYGALVVRGQTENDAAVWPDSPAAKVGLEENDVILSIDGQPLREVDLATVLRGKTVGQVIQLEVWRDGVVTTRSATLERAL